MIRKKNGILIIALLFLLASVLPLHAEEKSFHILSVNDPHSYILPYREAAAAGRAEGKTAVANVGGLSRALQLIADEKKSIGAESKSPIFLFEGGDIMLGKKGSLQLGHAEYESLSKSGFDAGVLGNHDFDGGVSILAKLGPKLKFPVLASNIKFHDTATDRCFPKTVIVEKNGVRIGLFGLVTPDLKASISDSSGFDIDKDIFKTAEECVRKLQAEGADAVVALTHIGLELDKQLAAKVSGIDVIVGGHSHDAVRKPLFVKNKDGSATLIGQAGLDGRFAGRYDITVGGGKLVEAKSSWKLMRVGSRTRPEPKSEALGREAEKILAESLGVSNPAVIFAKSIDARKDVMRAKENPLGNLAAEALRYHFRAQIGLINSGALRIGRIVPAGPFGACDMLDLMPFDSVPVKVMMKGSDIRAVLEFSASALIGRSDNYDYSSRASSGSFLQAAGIRFDIDLSEPAATVDGTRILTEGKRVKNITVDSPSGPVPLEDEKIYSVATLGYTAKGWPVLSSEGTDVSVLGCFDKYFAEVLNRKADPKTDGRINIR